MNFSSLFRIGQDSGHQDVNVGSRGSRCRSKTRQRRHGSVDGAFSIVEMIIVLVIIAILASIAIVSYGWMRNDALDAKTEATVSQVRKAIEIKKTKTGALYPTRDIRTREDLLKEYRIEELKGDVHMIYMPNARDCDETISDGCPSENNPIDIRKKPVVVVVGETIGYTTGGFPTIISHRFGPNNWCINSYDPGLDTEFYVYEDEAANEDPYGDHNSKLVRAQKPDKNRCMQYNDETGNFIHIGQSMHSASEGVYNCFMTYRINEYHLRQKLSCDLMAF